MYEVGNIVRIKDVKRVQYLNQSYIVTRIRNLGKHNIIVLNVEGLKNNMKYVMNHIYFEIDKSYERKKKIEKICTKLEMK